ncbi:non-ribosomal peptide synthetase [Streptacidiphilus jiangxiensis]|uniref:Amino acid adenylation domain-containing protein n=1 Tax=Streptacidiphilus jiangxiensis TaxID=235985 RepID=A0A1H7P9F2_STRJI|nr:non-ribosomal peptide synthetase [Streptacidiphilus jiangxiensis]SEL32430.1 amino acid adenylation domain-containing protein [Streptacidiphilus jiangxiensis]
MPELSPHQERLWFLQQLDPEDASYNIFWVHRLHGALDPAVLGRALDEVVSRHETLRTHYTETDGVPLARTDPSTTIALELVDLDGPGHAPDPGAALRAAHTEVLSRVRRPFDLAAGAPVRATLLRLAPQDHVLCVVVHHIAADGWSIRVLGAEIAHVYEAYAEGKPSPLAPLAHTHGDYTAELLGPEGRARSRAALDHWTGELTGAPDLELPTDLPRAPVRVSTGGLHKTELPTALLADIDKLARAHRCTAFMVLLAAWQVLLARHSGQLDFCVGTPVAGRTRVEHEEVVGCLATTVALRADLSGDPSFDALVDRVRSRTLAAFTHQHMPFAELLGRLEVARDRSRTPVYQTMFALQHIDSDGFALGGGSGDVLEIDYGQAKCDLAMEVWRGPGRTECHLSWSTGLFTADTARRVSERYLTLLRSLVSAPDAPALDADLLPEPERAELLLLGDGPALTATAGATALDRFLVQARATPDAPALDASGGDCHGAAERSVVSYRALDGMSAEIARRLRAHGVAPGDVVGVFVERSPALIAALLGVWRAGAAYLPLDPRYAATRTSLALEDSGARCVLVSSASADRLPQDCATPQVRVDGCETGHDLRSRALDGPPPGAQDTAYVLYTSGSTGRPKGVAVAHGALTAFLDATASLVGGTGPEATWLGLTSVSFDISGLETHLPLTTGGRLVLPDEEQAAGDGTDLARLARERAVTHLQATPTGWQVLLAAGLHAPRITALVGGEALPLPVARELRARTGRAVNLYGPTETTIWSSGWELPPDPPHVLIGTAIPGTRLRVLDRRGRLCPIGVPGELFIGGAGLSQGYLRRPALTADRFVPNPWGAPGARMYRTGDLVRHRADGGLEFLGRLDDQVKVRGHRIELGEVEAALRTAPQVRAAAARLHGDTLVGYVTGDADPAAVRAHLVALLPGYAVPTTVVRLDALPTTLNGKLDRSALPALAPTRAGEPAAVAYEGTAAEMHAIWCEVLGVDAVGPDEDLFDLGGHSLVISRIAARVRDRLGVDLPLHAYFDTPTITGLSRAVEELA